MQTTKVEEKEGKGHEKNGKDTSIFAKPWIRFS